MGGGGEEVVNIIFQPFQKIEIQPSPKKKKKKKKNFLSTSTSIRVGNFTSYSHNMIIVASVNCKAGPSSDSHLKFLKGHLSSYNGYLGNDITHIWTAH